MVAWLVQVQEEDARFELLDFLSVDCLEFLYHVVSDSAEYDSGNHHFIAVTHSRVLQGYVSDEDEAQA
jgi:hypothetical protein